jgi:hypothetical protein
MGSHVKDTPPSTASAEKPSLLAGLVASADGWLSGTKSVPKLQANETSKSTRMNEINLALFTFYLLFYWFL